MKLYKKRAVDILPLFFFIFLAIPLIYLPDQLNNLRAIRYVIMLALAAIGLSIYGIRQQVLLQYKQSPSIKRILIAALIVFISITAVIQMAQHDLIILGYTPDFLGLLSWLMFIVVALLFQANVRKLIFSRLSLCIFGVAMLLSIVYDTFYIHIGVRIPGVMFQPTTLAMYANVGIIVALYQVQKFSLRLRVIPWLVFILSFLVIGLCQSRIGNIMFTTTLIVWSYNALKQKRKALPAVLMAIMVIVIATPFVYKNYFSRLRSESVANGISYRFDLYKVSAKDIARHNILKGNGPGTLPTAVNNPNVVPEDIAQTLHFGFKFNSTHDLLFDYTYYFGLFATLSLTTFIGWSVWQYLKIKGEYAFAYLLIFIALFMNALFNVPSLELTSLFFVVLFGLTGTVLTQKITKATNQ